MNEEVLERLGEITSLWRSITKKRETLVFFLETRSISLDTLVRFTLRHTGSVHLNHAGLKEQWMGIL